MRNLALNTFGQVTLDSNGNGQVALGPALPGVTWTVTNEACSTTSITNESVFFLYLNQVGPHNLLAGSFSGNLDSASIPVTIFPGQTIIGLWTGGDASAVATLSLYGTQTVP